MCVEKKIVASATYNKLSKYIVSNKLSKYIVSVTLIKILFLHATVFAAVTCKK